MKRTTISFAVTLTVAIPLAIGTAHAADDWKFAASIYGYLPTIDGKTTFPPTGASSSATVDIGTILDSLKMNFAGTLEGHNGRWGLFTDIYYADIGNMKSGTRDISIGNAGLPAGVNANVDLDMKATMWTLGGGYRVSSTPTSTVDLIAGARMIDVRQTLKWELTGSVATVPVLDRGGERGVDARNWDAIVGAKGRATFGDGNKWFVPWYVDLGGGDSKLTWQAIGGVGYQFQWGSLVAVWRYIDYEFKSGKPMQSLSMNGPAIGAVFHW